MNKTHNSQSLSIEIMNAISKRGYTYNECSKAFNAAFIDEINATLIKPLNKDLLHRIKKNCYSMSSIRIAKLCDFLKIDSFKVQKNLSLTKEAYMVDDLLKNRPDLQPQIQSLISNIILITKGVSAS